MLLLFQNAHCTICVPWLNLFRNRCLSDLYYFIIKLIRNFSNILCRSDRWLVLVMEIWAIILGHGADSSHPYFIYAYCRTVSFKGLCHMRNFFAHVFRGVQTTVQCPIIETVPQFYVIKKSSIE